MRVLFLLAMGLVCGVVHAKSTTAQDFGACTDNFADGKAPQLVGDKGQKLAKNTTQLCFDGFAVLHSGVSKTPLWSAEHLTRTRIKQAKSLAREDGFHAEERLPAGQRAELSDYSRSGFDRGHLSPNGDMATKSQQFDSFSLANIAPQNGTHNRSVWRMIESSTRYLTNKHGEIYVVTGVVFAGKKIERIGSGVLVPSHFFKAVYIPKIGEAGVYYSTNSENATTTIISLNELAERTGIDVMPSLSAQLKSKRYELPQSQDDGEITTQTPKASKKNSENDKTAQESSIWEALILGIIKFLIGLFK